MNSDQSKAKQKWWQDLWSKLPIVLGQIFFGVVLSGMVAYLVAQYKASNFQSFELATVAGVLGGFPLVAASGERVSERTRVKLRAIGGLYLLAAILFVVFGFYEAADQAGVIKQNTPGSWIFTVVYVVTFYGGALALIGGMWMTLGIIPELVGLGPPAVHRL